MHLEASIVLTVKKEYMGVYLLTSSKWFQIQLVKSTISDIHLKILLKDPITKNHHNFQLEKKFYSFKTSKNTAYKQPSQHTTSCIGVCTFIKHAFYHFMAVSRRISKKAHSTFLLQFLSLPALMSRIQGPSQHIGAWEYAHWRYDGSSDKLVCQ